MATIRDVAKQSGYSITTFSRVLNQHGYVSEQAREKIATVIKELNYVPNGVARDLSIGQTHNIGVVLPHLDHPYFNQLVKGIVAASFPSAYRITLLPSQYDERREQDYLSQLHRKLFDGLIFASRALSLDQLAACREWGPLVVCEDPGDRPLSAVYSRRRDGYLAAFDWLKGQGHARIACLLARPAQQSATSAAVLGAFHQVYGEAAPVTVFDEVPDDFNAGYQYGHRLRRIEPSAVLVSGDAIAAGLRQAYAEAGAPLPLLVGQENQLAGQLMGLPTIDNHLVDLGQRAFELVADPPAEPQKVAVPASFLLGTQRQSARWTEE